jgi:hypothetical protein
MSKPARVLDAHHRGELGCRDFTGIAADSVALCDDQVDTGGGVPQQRDGFRPRHGLLVSLVRAFVMRGAVP